MERFVGWLWRRWRDRYVTAVAATATAVNMMFYVPFVAVCLGVLFGLRAGLVAGMILAIFSGPAMLLTGLWRVPEIPLVRRWLDGDQSDPAGYLEASFSFRDRVRRRSVVAFPALWAVTFGTIMPWLGELSPAETVAAIVYMAVGVVTTVELFIAFIDLLLSPARVELSEAGGAAAGLPSGTTTANRSTALAASFGIQVCIPTGIAATQFDTPGAQFIAIVVAATVAIAVIGRVYWYPLGVISLTNPIRELTMAARRIKDGDYSGRLPITSDDDLGHLAHAVNEMQRGLAERERLRSAFGSYVDPELATRLLEQGDDTFRGERREVTVMFVDIRDFTPFAEANPAEVAVARLNDVFEIVVQVVADHGGHVNKYLGDGAMAVFGAPNPLPRHGDQAVGAAREISAQVAARFGAEVRTGTGINTGSVIAGTIGGAGKLEYTLIGDAVNVAARVEQLTKTTGDAVLLTQATLDALASRPADLVDRGAHEVKGKAEPVIVHALGELPAVAAVG